VVLRPVYRMRVDLAHSWKWLRSIYAPWWARSRSGLLETLF